MFRKATLVALLFSAHLWAEPPQLKLPVEVHGNAGSFVTVSADTTGKTVRWLPLDNGLSMIPTQLLRDSKTAVLMAPPGRYRLLAFTAAGDEPSEPAITVIVIAGAAPKPPDTPPPVEPPPTQPPPPVTPAPSAWWVMVVQPDGPLSPALAANRKDPAWNAVREKANMSWVEASAVDPSYKTEVQSVLLPALFVLKIGANGKAQIVHKGTLPASGGTAAETVMGVMK